MITAKVCQDGITRCSWVTENKTYLEYHDREWGRPTKGQVPLFEAISLEGFQAGLSWLTILMRREAFRSAFSGFDPARIAEYDENDVRTLLGNSAIIRNKAKILSVINNARVTLEQNLDLTELLWSFAPDATGKPEGEFQWLATSPESEAMSKELKRLGFSFVGPTTMYALMQSSGMIFDHAPNCFVTK